MKWKIITTDVIPCLNQNMDSLLRNSIAALRLSTNTDDSTNVHRQLLLKAATDSNDAFADDSNQKILHGRISSSAGVVLCPPTQCNFTAAPSFSPQLLNEQLTLHFCY